MSDPITDLVRFLVGDTGDYNRFGAIKYVSVVPVADGFKYWLVQEGKFAAIPLQGTVVRDLLVPHIALLQPVVYGLEIFFAVSLTLGVAVRLAGVLAVLFMLQLRLGLYDDPTEWPWTYVAIVLAHGMFAVDRAGHRLGLDHLLDRRSRRATRSPTLAGRVLAMAS